ncbi:MAG: DUF3857 domain-containing protein [Bacteroidales bacterium]|nr:DUF3857 domain-containing protein [Bacteroidales bacterium]
MRTILSIIILMCLNIQLFAQKDSSFSYIKKVSLKDFEPTEIETLGDYKAVILYNQRYNYFDNYKGVLKFYNEYYFRYKALEDNFFENNQYRIDYSGRYRYEEIFELKAIIYRLENKKIKQIKVKFKDIIHVDRDSLNSYVLINFPEIKKGDIVEIKYSIPTFNFTNPPCFDFHSDYPCVQSRLITNFPEFMNYKFQISGDQSKININSKNDYFVMNYGLSLNSVKNSFIAYNILPEDNNYSYSPVKDYYDMKIYMYPYDFQDPPFHIQNWDRFSSLLYIYAEPENRYLSIFEASHILRNQGYIKIESNNWKRFTKYLRKSPKFWKPLMKSVPIDGELANIYDQVDNLDTLAIIQKLYDYVRFNIKWDSTYNNIINKTPENVLKDKIGSSSEINMTLISLLRRVGLNAYPVLASTRDNGNVDPNYVNLLQYNNVLAYVNFQNDNEINQLILDATSPYRPYNILDVNDLNNMYLVVDLIDHSFISRTSEIHNSLCQSILVEKSNNGYSVNLSEKTDNYFASERNLFLAQNSDSEFLSKFLKLNISNSDIISSNKKDSLNYFSYETFFKVSESQTKNLLKNILGENPFTQDDRQIPVDFIFPRHYFYQITYNDVDYKQISSQTFSALNGALNAQIANNEIDGKNIQILKLDINKQFFEVSEYSELKEFFDKLYSLF